MNPRSCSVDGCGEVAHARGLCNSHYARSRRHSEPTGGGTPKRRYVSPEATFSARTEWQAGCLIWASAGANGYGQLTVHGRVVGAHRYAWERANGPIPDGTQIDHICHNRACVNVAHLRLASPEQNQRNRSGAQRGSASGVRNVHRRRGQWRVSVQKNGKTYLFGEYGTVDEAAAVAERARRALFGTYAGKGWA